MRFVAAQFNALLDDDLWLELAGHANAMATELHAATAGLPGVEPARPPAVEQHVPRPRLPARSSRCRTGRFFWDWDRRRHQVRWMTAWDTTIDDVEAFASGVRGDWCHSPARDE